LGKRMSGFLSRRFDEQAERVVLIGTDSPTLPLAIVERAFRELESADVVFGPATDGGYYLLGCAKRRPPIFDGIAWGTATVLENSVRLAGAAGCRFALLEEWYDVDTKDDWEALKQRCQEMRAEGVDPGIPATEALF